MGIGWTQPLCIACWNVRNPDRQAVDPATVKFPQNCG